MTIDLKGTTEKPVVVKLTFGNVRVGQMFVSGKCLSLKINQDSYVDLTNNDGHTRTRDLDKVDRHEEDTEIDRILPMMEWAY